jgi:hypothetical protein
MSNLVSDGRSVYYPELAAQLQAAGIEPGMPRGVIARRLEPVIDDLQAWIYARIAREARKNGAQPVWVFLPAPYQHPPAQELEKRMQQMRQAGFTALSLAGAYDGHGARDVQVSQWDTHPNALGHRLVAARFYQELRRAGLLASSESPARPAVTGISRAGP